MSVYCECCVLSGALPLGVADHSSTGIVPTVVFVAVCDREATIIRRSWPTRGCCAMEESIVFCKSLNKYEKRMRELT